MECELLIPEIPEKYSKSSILQIVSYREYVLALITRYNEIAMIENQELVSEGHEKLICLVDGSFPEVLLEIRNSTSGLTFLQITLPYAPRLQKSNKYFSSRRRDALLIIYSPF